MLFQHRRGGHSHFFVAVLVVLPLEKRAEIPAFPVDPYRCGEKIVLVSISCDRRIIGDAFEHDARCAGVFEQHLLPIGHASHQPGPERVARHSIVDSLNRTRPEEGQGEFSHVKNEADHPAVIFVDFHKSRHVQRLGLKGSAEVVLTVCLAIVFNCSHVISPSEQ